MDTNKSEQGNLFDPTALPEVPDMSLILAGDVPLLLYQQLSGQIGIMEERIVECENKKQRKMRLINSAHPMTGFAGAIGVEAFRHITSQKSVFYLWETAHQEWEPLACTFRVSGGPVYTGGWSAAGGNHISEDVFLGPMSPDGVLSPERPLITIAFICYFVARITENPRYQGRRYYEDDFLKDMTDWSPAN